MKFFVNGRKPITNAELEAAESRLGFSFPSDYREALLHSNGGSFAVPAFEHEGYSIYLQTAFDLDRLESSRNGRLVIGFTGNGKDIELDESGVFVDGFELGSSLSEVFERCNQEDAIAKLDKLSLWIQNGESERIQQLLNTPELRNRPNANGKTPAQLAALHNQTDLLSWLIQEGANLAGATHFAARYGGVDSVELLHKSGVDINELNPDGETPLDFITPDCWGTRHYLKNNGGKTAAELDGNSELP